jgi:hypothetical protein
MAGEYTIEMPEAIQPDDESEETETDTETDADDQSPDFPTPGGLRGL